jgi:hypothetical protein
MPLTAGTRLGPYEIVAALGAGGMGEVYRARDARLQRDVAIKALPAEFAQDPAHLARFEREARLLASLSHPNIAAIFGLEESAGARYLVLELIEGETLSTRLARGPLSVDEAVEIGRHIAAGVEAAHESGVVHRDLKPGNIMLTPGGAVKVLDFGLARGATEPGSGAVSLDALTLTHPATAPGVILGTAAYMSPEQARGKPVDRRTDVWSFGCVLFECLAGRRVFEGETTSDLLARILEREPDWSALPARTPPHLVHLLRRCLTKDPQLRLRDVGEARIALSGGSAEVAGDPPARAPAQRAWIVPVAAALVAALVTAGTIVALRPAPAVDAVRRYAMAIPDLDLRAYAPLAITRDGGAIAYDAGGRVWIRRLEQTDPIEVPGSEGGRAPFWSWDGTSIGFGAGGKVWTFTPGTEQSRLVCDAPGNGRLLGGAWGPDGRIVFAVWRDALYEVPATGGEARTFAALDTTLVDFHGPTWLPDGRTLLVFAHAHGDGSGPAVFEGSPPRMRLLVEENRSSVVSYAPTGHLLLTRELGRNASSIRALPFSLRERRVTGPEFPVLERAELAAGAGNGLFVAVENPSPAEHRLVWKLRDGGGETAFGAPAPGMMFPVVSPDGRRVAFVTVRDGNSDLWVHDVVRGTRVPVTSGPHLEEEPAWSADGRRLFYTSIQNLGVGTERIVAISADGSGVADTLVRGQQACPSPDGASLLFSVDRRGNSDLWRMRLDPPGSPEPFLVTASNEASARISPNGRWAAYSSDESGVAEVYLRRYPEGDGRELVSVGGGNWPRWTPRGDAITYLHADSLVIVSFAAATAGMPPTFGTPRALFPARAQAFDMGMAPITQSPLDPHPDGTRFVGTRQDAPSPVRSVLFLENWTAGVPGAAGRRE